MTLLESINDTPFDELEPTVDVAIPTLGDSSYLVEAVESVMGQTHTSWRLVISENAAGHERTRTALEPYLRDPRVRHVVRGETTPRGEHYTCLIQTGTAPYVAVLHDDDRWGPGFLERRVRFLDDYPKCGFVFSGYHVIDEGGKVTGRSRNVLAAGAHPSSSMLPVLFRSNPIAVPTVLVRRSAYEAVGAEYLEILFNDHEMWLRLAANADVGILDGWDADYRVHVAQTSFMGRLELAEKQFEVLDAVKGLPISEKFRRRARAKTHMRCALDLIELGRRRDALSHVARAVRVDPSCLIHPDGGGRALAAFVALASGNAGRRALSRRRHELYRSRRAEFVTSREGESVARSIRNR